MFGLTKPRYEKDKIEVYVDPNSGREDLFLIRSRYRSLVLDALRNQ